MDDEVTKQIAIKSVEDAFEENQKIKGHLAELSEGRLVFIGELEGYQDEWLIAFRNKAGDDTRIRLSKDALAMLFQLYSKPKKGHDIFPMRIRMAWQVTVKEKEEA